MNDIDIYLQEIFPEDISPEAAFYLTEFLANLSALISKHYYKKVEQHLDDIRSMRPKFLAHNDIDNSF